MDPELHDPIPFSNWVGLVGVLLLTLAVVWVASWIYAYHKLQVEARVDKRSLSAIAKSRYSRQIEQIVDRWKAGELNQREAHLALAALMRAAGSEMTGVNLESATPSEVGALFPQWGTMQEALVWCEQESFPASVANRHIEGGASLARQVIEG